MVKIAGAGQRLRRGQSLVEHMVTFVCSFAVRQSPLGPLRLWICPLTPEIYPLRPAICPFRPWIWDFRPERADFRREGRISGLIGQISGPRGHISGLRELILGLRGPEGDYRIDIQTGVWTNKSSMFYRTLSPLGLLPKKNTTQTGNLHFLGSGPKGPVSCRTQGANLYVRLSVCPSICQYVHPPSTP